MNRNFPPSAAEAGFDGESEHNMFSLKRLMVLTLVVSWIAGAGRLVAQTLPPQTMSPQTTTANLKSPDPATSDTAKPADTAKPEVIVPAGYIVGDSDVIRVNVWKEPEVSQTVVVRTDGNISLPLINEVKVSGMTPLQIQDMVAEKLKGFLNNPQVTVTVIEIRSKRAFITGEVARPGTYSLNAQTTVLQLIAQAGGFTPFAKKDSIVVLRTEDGRQSRLKFKYKEVVQGKKTEQNIALHPGDTVVVP
jgi:polysaccharide export outer membrane protein